jgi:large subunit ribosomal protein L9
MKIILNQDVRNLGEEGDTVEVKRGYARNFLLPKNLGVPSNKTNQSIFASRMAAIEKRKEEKRKSAASLKERLDTTTIRLVVSAGDSGKLFGSVTNNMVQEALAKEGIEIDRKRIEVASHSIKTIGNYSVKVRLYENETAQVNVIVISETEVKRAEAAKAVADKAAAKLAAAAHPEKAPVVVEEVTYGQEGEEEFDEDSEE